jgi:hypothetical protein
MENRRNFDELSSLTRLNVDVYHLKDRSVEELTSLLHQTKNSEYAKWCDQFGKSYSPSHVAYINAIEVIINQKSK